LGRRRTQQQSHARAAQHGLRDAGDLATLVRQSEIIVSVCPPHAAKEVATEVVEQGFQGIYIDANAISPQRATNIATQITAGGASFVDGGIVGGPEHSTRANDALPGREFDFLLSNPTYGKSWKTDLERMGGKDRIKDPRFVVTHEDAEFPLKLYIIRWNENF
jgi:hypothetical protein